MPSGSEVLLMVRRSVVARVAQVTMALALGALASQPLMAATDESEATPAGTAARTNATLSAATSEPAPQDAAQDNTDSVVEFFRKVEVSGILDTYYTYNFNEPTTGEFTPLRSFDLKHNQFSVALVELAFDKPASEDDRIGFRFDLQYGQVAQVFNSDPLDNNNLVNVQQGYLAYLAPIGKGLTLDVGKFVTAIGTEPTEAHLNSNYSRALLYQYGPFYHVGARLTYPVHDKFTLGAMLANGWNTSGDNNAGKSFGVSATVVPTSKITVVQNVIIGPEQEDNTDDIRTYSDTNLAVAATDTISAGLNYIYGKDRFDGTDASWQGLALYLKGQITPVFALAPRFEWFDDSDGVVFAPVAQKMKEFTMTAEVKHPRGLIMRLEYRRDWSDIDFFEKNGVAKNNQNTFTVGFIYAFSSRNP